MKGVPSNGGRNLPAPYLGAQGAAAQALAEQAALAARDGLDGLQLPCPARALLRGQPAQVTLQLLPVEHMAAVGRQPVLARTDPLAMQRRIGAACGQQEQQRCRRPNRLTA